MDYCTNVWHLLVCAHMGLSQVSRTRDAGPRHALRQARGCVVAGMLYLWANSWEAIHRGAYLLLCAIILASCCLNCFCFVFCFFVFFASCQGQTDQEVLDNILLYHSLMPYPLHRSLEDRGLSVCWLTHIVLYYQLLYSNIYQYYCNWSNLTEYVGVIFGFNDLTGQLQED